MTAQQREARERRVERVMRGVAPAIAEIRSVETWLSNEVEAGDTAVKIHRDALRVALVHLGAYPA